MNSITFVPYPDNRPGGALINECGEPVAQLDHIGLVDLVRQLNRAMPASRDCVAEQSRRDALATILPARRTDFVDLEV